MSDAIWGSKQVWMKDKYTRCWTFSKRCACIKSSSIQVWRRPYTKRSGGPLYILKPLGSHVWNRNCSWSSPLQAVVQHPDIQNGEQLILSNLHLRIRWNMYRVYQAGINRGASASGTNGAVSRHYDIKLLSGRFSGTATQSVCSSLLLSSASNRQSRHVLPNVDN